MLDRCELKQLSKWCRARRLHWQPGVADSGRPAVLLLGTPRDNLMLVMEDDEWRLLDQPGQVLAAAGGLTELLDALDGGVDEDIPTARPELAVSGMALMLA